MPLRNQLKCKKVTLDQRKVVVRWLGLEAQNIIASNWLFSFFFQRSTLPVYTSPFATHPQSTSTTASIVAFSLLSRSSGFKLTRTGQMLIMSSFASRFQGAVACVRGEMGEDIMSPRAL